MPEDSREMFSQRGSVDHIILLDWTSSVKDLQPRTTLRTLKDALYKVGWTNLITARKRSCVKVMFSQLSICPQGGGVGLCQRPPPYPLPSRQRSSPRTETPSFQNRDRPTEYLVATTAAGGTYPTGMHACLMFVSASIQPFL